MPRHCREAERAMQRYEEWMQLRDIGIRQCEEKNLPLPTYLREPPPPPPEPFHDEDVGDVSAEMIQHETAEGSESFNLERSLADDQVPLADPEVEGLHRSPMVSWRMLCTWKDRCADALLRCRSTHRSTRCSRLHHLARTCAGKAFFLVRTVCHSLIFRKPY